MFVQGAGSVTTSTTHNTCVLPRLPRGTYPLSTVASASRPTASAVPGTTSSSAFSVFAIRFPARTRRLHDCVTLSVLIVAVVSARRRLVEELRFLHGSNKIPDTKYYGVVRPVDDLP